MPVIRNNTQEIRKAVCSKIRRKSSSAGLQSWRVQKQTGRQCQGPQVIQSWISTKIPTSRAPARRDRDVQSTLHPPRADPESNEAICVLSLCTLLPGFCTTAAVRRVYAFLSSSSVKVQSSRGIPAFSPNPENILHPSPSTPPMQRLTTPTRRRRSLLAQHLP